MAEHMRAEPVRDALDLAAGRGLTGDDAIFHADRGTQYSSGLFRGALTGDGIRPSAGRAGSCFDNAVAESFFATLKTEIGTTVRPRPTRRVRPYRLLQPRPPTFRTRLPRPARSPRRLPSSTHPRGRKSGVRFSGTTSGESGSRAMFQVGERRVVLTHRATGVGVSLSERPRGRGRAPQSGRGSVPSMCTPPGRRRVRRGSARSQRGCWPRGPVLTADRKVCHRSSGNARCGPLRFREFRTKARPVMCASSTQSPCCGPELELLRQTIPNGAGLVNSEFARCCTRAPSAAGQPGPD